MNMVMDLKRRSFISYPEGNIKPRGDRKDYIIQNYVYYASYMSTMRNDGNRRIIAFCVR